LIILCETFKAATTHFNGQSKDFSVSGNQLTGELKEEINSLVSGERIKFYDIEIKVPETNSKENLCKALPITVIIK